MAYGYWKSGTAEKESVFSLFFRKNPFGGGLTVACGLEQAIDFIRNFRFTDDDVAYLATLTGNDEAKLRRYTANTAERTPREEAPFVLTHETIAKVAEVLAGE